MGNPAVDRTDVETIFQRLDALSRDQPELAGACAHYRRLLPRLIQARERALPIEIDAGQAQAQLDRGEAIFPGEPLPLRSPALGTLFEQTREVVAGKNGTAQALSLDSLADLLQAVVAGDPGPIQSTASRLGLEPAQLQVIAQNSLKPFLHAWRTGLAPEVDVVAWHKGICPFCGSQPLLAELRGPQRARRLRCGLCGADWPFPRLQCVACGNRDERSLGILQPDDPLRRSSVQFCRVCHGYLKMVVTTEPIPDALLPVEDLATLPLDLIAQKFGYTRLVG